MRRRSWIVAAVALLLVAGAGWYFGSPYYTLWQVRRAVDSNDADALAGYIDFPAVREDLKGELNAQIAAEARRRGAAVSGLAQAFGPAVLNLVVDNVVTPAGVRTMLANRPESSGPGVDGGPGVPGVPGVPGTSLPDQPEITRRGISEFTVFQPGRPGALIFTRHGLGWKLSGFDLPPRPTDAD